MGRFFISFLAALTSLAFASRANAADAPTLVEVIDSKGFSQVGELLRDKSDAVTIFELRTGKERVIQRSDIKEIKHDISDEDAIAETDLPAVMAWKVRKIDVSTPQVGRVAKISDAVIYLTLGAKDGVTEGQKLPIYRNNGDIVDPVTKKVIAQDRPRIAQVQVTEAQEGYCKAKLMGDLEVKLQAGDECELPTLKMRVAVFPLVDTEGKVSEAGQAMTENLTTSMVQHGVPVVERELLRQVMTELALQNTVLFDEKQAQQIGVQAGASCVLTGKIVSEDGRWVAHVRLIDVKTGKIVLAASQRMRGVVAPGTARSSATAPSAGGPSGGGAAVAGNGIKLEIEATVDGIDQFVITNRTIKVRHMESIPPTNIKINDIKMHYDEVLQNEGATAYFPTVVDLDTAKIVEKNGRGNISMTKNANQVVLKIEDPQPQGSGYAVTLEFRPK